MQEVSDVLTHNGDSTHKMSILQQGSVMCLIRASLPPIFRISNDSCGEIDFALKFQILNLGC
jgi:hypothetical protein